MQDFHTTILGNVLTTGLFFGYLVIAIFTSLLILGIRGNIKRKGSNRSPEKFSLSYLLYDNRRRIFVSLGVMAFSIRFCPELLQTDITPWGAAIIGGSVHVLAGLIKNLFKTVQK